MASDLGRSATSPAQASCRLMQVRGKVMLNWIFEPASRVLGILEVWDTAHQGRPTPPEGSQKRSSSSKPAGSRRCV